MQRQHLGCGDEETHLQVAGDAVTVCIPDKLLTLGGHLDKLCSSFQAYVFPLSRDHIPGWVWFSGAEGMERGKPPLVLGRVWVRKCYQRAWASGVKGLGKTGWERFSFRWKDWKGTVACLLVQWASMGSLCFPRRLSRKACYGAQRGVSPWPLTEARVWAEEGDGPSPTRHERVPWSQRPWPGRETEMSNTESSNLFLGQVNMSHVLFISLYVWD